MKDFIEMSKYAGMREDLVQAGGGNSAYKMEKDRMLVKASGIQLADVGNDSGYAVVNPRIIREAFLGRNDIDSMTEKEADEILQKAFMEGGRPSIETFLHAVSGRYSLHTHPVVVNILAGRENGMEVLHRLFPQALLVPYATPGIPLAKKFFKEVQKRGKDTDVVFLQNHGLLVSSREAAGVIRKTEEVVKKIEDYLDMDMSGYHEVTELYNAIGTGIIWRVTDIHVIEAGTVLGRVWESSFCPDCVVFLGKRMYDAGNRWDDAEYKKFRAAFGEPVIIAYREELYIHAESVGKAMEIQSVLGFAAQVMQANAGEKMTVLSFEEQEFLTGWEAERYRKNKK